VGRREPVRRCPSRRRPQPSGPRVAVSRPYNKLFRVEPLVAGDRAAATSFRELSEHLQRVRDLVWGAETPSPGWSICSPQPSRGGACCRPDRGGTLLIMILTINETAAPAHTSLDEQPFGRWAEIRSVDAPPVEARWLAALGLAPGQRVAVLRRAAWGGPLHVRTEGAGEVALGLDLAHVIHVAAGARCP